MNKIVNNEPPLLDQLDEWSGKFFTKLGKLVGIVLPFLLLYGCAFYYGIKFFKSTDALVVIKMGFLLTWIAEILPPSSSAPTKKFKLGKWTFTFGSSE